MDRVKVIRGLELCSTAIKNFDPRVNCNQCPYKEKDNADAFETNCDDLLMMDALALLTERRKNE